jgi:hypothetical protein
MAIPTVHDAILADIENTANTIMTKLRVMERAGTGPRDFDGLRRLLQTYNDIVINFANLTNGPVR